MERQDPCSNRPVLAVPEPTEIAEIGDADRSPASVNRPWSTETVYADWLAWRFGNFRSYIWRYFTCRQVPPCHCPVINLRATVLHPDRIFPLSPCRSKMFYFSTLFSLVFMWVILLLQPKHLPDFVSLATGCFSLSDRYRITTSSRVSCFKITPDPCLVIQTFSTCSSIN